MHGGRNGGQWVDSAMETAAAFAPANISLVFETYEAEPPHGRGSLGVGITLTEGVRVEVSRARGGETEIVVGGEKWDSEE